MDPATVKLLAKRKGPPGTHVCPQCGARGACWANDPGAGQQHVCWDCQHQWPVAANGGPDAA